MVRPSSCNVKGGIQSSRRYLPTYLPWWPRDGRLAVVCVGGGIAINPLGGPPHGAHVAWSGGGAGGKVWVWHCWCWGGRGCVFRWLRVWASRWVVWVLHVLAVRSLRSLAGCGAKVRVGGRSMGVWAWLWSVGNGWLPVDGARWYGVWVGGLVVVVRVGGSPRVDGGVRWSVRREPVYTGWCVMLDRMVVVLRVCWLCVVPRRWRERW